MTMTKLEINRFVANITTMEEYQALEDVMKYQASLLETEKSTDFEVGQVVEFETQRAGKVHGVIEKVNPRSIKVKQTEDNDKAKKGKVWPVAPSRVRIVKSASLQ